MASSKMSVTYSENEIRQAFIEPIRSVLLIDDAYPRYEELVDSIAGAVLPEHLINGASGARAIIELCREQNIVCDIENRPNRITDGLLHNIGKSDLVVLDFHLNRADDRDIKEALQILSKLADSPHGNLVIVHTKDRDLDAVKLKIAGYLRGHLPSQVISVEITAAVARWQPELSVEIVEQHIMQGSIGWRRNVPELRAQLVELGVRGVDQEVIITDGIEDYLRKNGAPLREDAIALFRK